MQSLTAGLRQDDDIGGAAEGLAGGGLEGEGGRGSGSKSGQGCQTGEKALLDGGGMPVALLPAVVPFNSS